MSNWIETVLEPRFFEVDSYKIVNNMFYLSWFEMGRFAIAERVGLLVPRFAEENLGFVVTRSEVLYKKPVTFGTKIRSQGRIRTVEASRLVFDHRISALRSSVVYAQGTTEVVCVRDGKLLMRLPDWVQDLIIKFIKDVQGGFPHQ